MPSSSSFRPDAMVGYVAELRCRAGGGHCEHGGNGWRWGGWAWTPLDGVGCCSGGPGGRGLIAPSPSKEHTLYLSDTRAERYVSCRWIMGRRQAQLVLNANIAKARH